MQGIQNTDSLTLTRYLSFSTASFWSLKSFEMSRLDVLQGSFGKGRALTNHNRNMSRDGPGLVLGLVQYAWKWKDG